MRLGPSFAALACAAGVTVSACSVFSIPPTARSVANKIGCTGFEPLQHRGFERQHEPPPMRDILPLVCHTGQGRGVES